ncbi:MAG: TolC family protein [Rikenellaceae bacterium]
MSGFKFWSVAALLSLSSISAPLFAQSPHESLSMTLDECLEYAKENSITLQKARLSIEDSQSDQVSAKGAFLPSLSAYVGQDFNTNPTNTDVNANKTSYTGSYGFSLSMTLYSGGSNRAKLLQSGISNQIANLELDEFENSLEVSITQTYVEILYAMEQILAAEYTLELSKKNLERGVVYLEVGSINQVDYAQLESAVASYEYDLVVCQSQLTSLYVELKHLLEISQDIEFSVVQPEISAELLSEYIPSLNDVYSVAVESRPEIASTQLSVDAAELDVTIAKAGYLPSLSLSAGTGLNHNTSSAYTFGSQLQNNFNTSVGVNLSVPIFSKFQNRTAVAKSENSVRTASLNLTQTQKDLYQTIETLHNNTTTAQAKYSVSQNLLETSKKSMDLTTQQYEVGMKNTIELLTEQDNYQQAYQDFLVNKYQLILNKALLNYYKTNLIKL